MPSLGDELLKKRPREDVGGPTKARFDFQINWALTEIIRRHTSGDDYCVAMEFHDDVVFFDSSANPSAGEFFQLKTRRGKYWLLSDLVRASKGKKDKGLILSHLAKLITHYVQFGSNVRSLNFVSDARYKVGLTNSPDNPEASLAEERICLTSLANREREKIRKALKEQMPPGVTGYEPITFLTVCSLSLDDQAAHARGRVHDFLASEIATETPAVNAFYRSLYDELDRKAKNKPDYSSHESLINSKMVPRSVVEQLLKNVDERESLSKVWTMYENRMHSEQVPLKQIRNIRSAWGKYVSERHQTSNLSIQRLRSDISDAVSRAEDNFGLVQLLSSVRKKLGRRDYPQDYLDAAILVEFELNEY